MMTSLEIATKFIDETGTLHPNRQKQELAQLIHNVYVVAVQDTVSTPFWRAVPTEVNIDEYLLFY